MNCIGVVHGAAMLTAEQGIQVVAQCSWCLEAGGAKAMLALTLTWRGLCTSTGG
jgi:hypothetical protein